MPGLERNVDRRAHAAYRSVAAPHLDLRHDTDLVADFQQRAVTLGGRHWIDRATGTRRRSGYALGPELCEQIHVELGLLKSLRALGIVIDNPSRKPDGALDRQSVVVDALTQILQRTTVVLVFVEFAEPRLDSGITGLGCDINLLGDRQILSADRARVQAVLEGIAAILFCRLGFGAGTTGQQSHCGNSGSFHEITTID